MAKSKRWYLVEIAYPADRYPDLDDHFEKMAGRHCCGSGYGMGTRDMDWGFKTKAARDKVRKRLAKSRIPGFSISISDRCAYCDNCDCTCWVPVVA